MPSIMIRRHLLHPVRRQTPTTPCRTARNAPKGQFSAVSRTVVATATVSILKQESRPHTHAFGDNGMHYQNCSTISVLFFFVKLR